MACLHSYAFYRHLLGELGEKRFNEAYALLRAVTEDDDEVASLLCTFPVRKNAPRPEARLLLWHLL